MNSSQSPIRLFSAIACAIYAIISVAGIIITAIALSPLTQPYRQSSGITGWLIFEIITFVILFIFSLISIVLFLKDISFQKYAFQIIMLLIAIPNLITLFIAASASSYSRQSNSTIPISLNIAIVFLFIIIILNFVSIGLARSLLHENYAPLVCFISYLLIAIVQIISIVLNADQTGALVIVDYVFELLAAIIVLIVLICNFIDFYDISNSTSRGTYHNSTIGGRTSNKNSDLEIKLNAIKKLFELGVISQEEYEKKKDDILKSI